MWKEGTIGIPDGKGKYTACHYWIKVYEEPSVFGINEGRISKLMIKINKKGCLQLRQRLGYKTDLYRSRKSPGDFTF